MPTSFIDYARASAGLDKVPEPAQQLIADLVERLLHYEGPPVEPIPGYSQDHRRELVRSHTGRILAVAETWVTSPWRCLLLESPSVGMGRPIFLPRRGLAGKKFLTLADVRVVTDTRTRNAIRRIVAACSTFELGAPLEQGVVFAAFSAHRTFVAWREQLEEESFGDMRYDVDNLSKTVLDGLQSAGVVRNDRGVIRLIATKPLPDSWSSPPPTIDEVIQAEVARRRREQGLDLETIRVEMRLSRARMMRLFPEYKPTRVVKRDPDQEAFLARRAVEIIVKEGKTYKEAREETRARASVLRPEIAAALRPAILEGQVSIEQIAHRLAIDVRTASRIFKGDSEVLAALRRRQPASREETRAALERALKDVLAGMPATEAARKHGVSPGSLRSKVGRARKRKDVGRE